MRTGMLAGRLLALAASLLLLAACAEDGDPADPVELDGTDTDAVEEDADAAPDEPSEAADDDADGEPAIGEGDAPVDMTEAVAGTWPVGDAGTVTFSISDGSLVLEDVTTAEGWDADIDEEDPDEIEIDFRRDNVEWMIEIELQDGRTILEIEIDQDIDGAEPGTYDIGDAGDFTFSVSDSRLVLDELNIADGWTLAELDEDSDEIDFEVIDGPREYDVEIDLEGNGTVDIEIDFEVVGPVDG